MSTIKNFTSAARLPAPDVATARKIENLLRELKQKHADSLGRLILPLTVADYQAQTRLANAKSKIGVIFGSDPTSEKQGKTTTVSGAILCKLFTLTMGGHDRNAIQLQWARQLDKYYNELKVDMGSENDAKYNTFFAEAAANLQAIIEQLQENRDVTDFQSSDPRSYKGPVLLGLMPDELKKHFIMDFVDTYLQRQAQKNYSPANLALFVVPQDPFPHLWKAPEGATIEAVVEPTAHGQVTEAFELPKQLKIDWSESAKEKYFPAFGWEPDKDAEGNPVEREYQTIELDEEGNPVEAIERRQVYTLARNIDYRKQLENFDASLKEYEEYARFDFVKNAIKQQSADKVTARSEGFATYYAQVAKQKFGNLIGVVTAGDKKIPTLTLSGKAFYLLCAEQPALTQEIKDLSTAVKKLDAAKQSGQSANVEAVVKEIASIAKRKLLPPNLPEEEAKKLALEIAYVARMSEAKTTQEQLKALAEKNYPKNVYDASLGSKGILPSSKEAVEIGTSHSGNAVDLVINTKRNPFYLPMAWPSTMQRGDTPWPDAALSSATRGMRTEWGRLPWSTFSLKDKKSNFEKMKREFETTQDPVRKNLLRPDVDTIEKALFMDELRAYVKMNLAFNIDDPDSPSLASKLENPPPLFHIEGAEGAQPVTLRDLLEKETCESVQNTYGKQYFDVATNESANFGFKGELPDFIEAQLRQQLTKQALLVQKLQRIASEANLTNDIEPKAFFDLEGKSFSNLESLQQSLVQKGLEVPVEEKIACANLLIKLTNDLVRKDKSLERLIQDAEKVVKVLYKGKPQQEIKQDKTVEIPGQQDEEEDFALPPIQFPQPKKEEIKVEEKLPIAASISPDPLRRFTRGV